MGAAGEQCDAVATEAELTHEIVERKLLKEERNIVTDVEWGLHA